MSGYLEKSLNLKMQHVGKCSREPESGFSETFLINTSSLKARRKEEKDGEREIKINKLLFLCMDIWLEKKLKDRQNTYA